MTHLVRFNVRSGVTVSRQGERYSVTFYGLPRHEAENLGVVLAESREGWSEAAQAIFDAVPDREATS